MNVPPPPRVRALQLMRRAIILLDEAREDIAAARLQAAIDTVEPSPPTERGGARPKD
jgi:hypothetical protein